MGTGQRPSAGRRWALVDHLRAEDGISIIEALVAAVVLVVGLAGMLGVLVAATHSTATNRLRQAGTSLAREVTEDVRTLGYDQILQSTLASKLQPLVPNATVSSTTLLVNRSAYTFKVQFTECSLDDPSDGYGSHSAPPASGGSWCPDVATSGTADTNPDDYKRVSVIVNPLGGRTTPLVQQAELIYSEPTNGPATSCLSTTATCPGANVTISSAGQTSLTFNDTTTALASAVQWQVNGNPPPAAQIASGATDPYVPSANPSAFAWTFPTADGTYSISALGFDANGNQGTPSSLQITLNRHQVIAPTSLTAGWNNQIHGVDIQWVPSVDGDVLYYRVYHKVGAGAATLVTGCSHVTGTSCMDLTATAPTGTPTCLNPSQSYTTSNSYYVVGVDTDPVTGLPRESTAQSPSMDANLCDHPPSAPTSLSGTLSNGTMTLSWTAPSPADPDAGDSIDAWRIYRWASPGTAQFPGSRLDLVGVLNGSGQQVTSYSDTSADPGGVAQSYCVTSIDNRLNESSCSNVVTG